MLLATFLFKRSNFARNSNDSRICMRDNGRCESPKVEYSARDLDLTCHLDGFSLILALQ